MSLFLYFFQNKERAVAWGMIFFLTCSKPSVISPVYVPIIEFSGYVNNDSIYYPGNRFYPNTCRIENNCVRMYFYSENYSQGLMNCGDQMRLDVLGVDSQFITERNALFTLTRYDQISTTSTYTISSLDTLNTYNDIYMRVESFEKRSGGKIHITEISVAARPLGQFASGPLAIMRGTIFGSIE
jgi:hypothetical protein